MNKYSSTPIGPLLGNAQQRSYPKGQIILYQGDTPPYMFLLKQGEIKVYDIDEQGNEKILYIIESRGVPTRKILAYDVSPSGDKLSNKRVFVDAGPSTPDGFRVDIDGNLWCGWGMGDANLDGVMVFAPDGAPIGRIALPERCANVCFGGVKRNRLFMAASQSIYALYVNTQGALGG